MGGMPVASQDRKEACNRRRRNCGMRQHQRREIGVGEQESAKCKAGMVFHRLASSVSCPARESICVANGNDMQWTSLRQKTGAQARSFRTGSVVEVPSPEELRSYSRRAAGSRRTDGAKVGEDAKTCATRWGQGAPHHGCGWLPGPRARPQLTSVCSGDKASPNALIQNRLAPPCRVFQPLAAQKINCERFFLASLHTSPTIARPRAISSRAFPVLSKTLPHCRIETLQAAD
jgi:hypothetical protein